MAKIKLASGEELSEEDIEALADEAERGYDLSKATKVTIGRPSLASRAPPRACRSVWIPSSPKRSRPAPPREALRQRDRPHCSTRIHRARSLSRSRAAS